MRRLGLFCLPVLIFLSSSLGGQEMARYAVKKKVVEGHTTYHLLDSKLKMDYGIVPDIGNLGYEFKVNGKDVLIPPESFESYLKARWFCCGNPFLWPWANRIDRDYYYFQGRKYLLNDELGNILRDPFKQVIHGLVTFEPRWEVVRTGASDTQGAYVVSRLDFYKYPDLMAQFPFAHTVELTNRLKAGKLEVTTKISNISNSAMPILTAHHPYFRVDGERQEWRVSNSTKYHILLTDKLVPTGEKELTETYLPGAKDLVLGTRFLDALFNELERGKDGLGRISVQGRTQKIEVVYDKEYDYAVIYAPVEKNLICIEPQTGPTNAFNLNHEGKYAGLRVLEAGKTFSATYWIVPTGY